MTKTVLYTDNGFGDASIETTLLEGAGAVLVVDQCRTEGALLAKCESVDALLVQWAPVTGQVIERMAKCRHIVRLGVGVDNVDIAAATAKGIAVSNVPDYCVNEVADHTMTMVLALLRQLSRLDSRLRSGTWRIVPDSPMPAFRKMTLATLGFGRIARGVHERARAFGFRLIAHDPDAHDVDFADLGVERVSLEMAFAEADVLSLHCPLNESTAHLVNRKRLKQMRAGSIVVNTARGGLVDTVALAEALSEKMIGGAGLDVFEQEPLESNHPILTAPNTLLTSHVAWYSDSSVPELRRSAAAEIVRGLKGEKLHYRIN